MASRKISDLAPSVRAKVEAVENLCAHGGVSLLVYCTYRDAYEQARHFRKSRTISQINQKIAKLVDRGYPELGRIITVVGPQAGVVGRHVTWAGPGESWHQYALAFDAVPMVGGKCLWEYGKFEEQWQVYGDAVEAVGLHWGGRFRDFPHAQNSMRGNPLDVLSLKEVKEKLILTSSHVSGGNGGTV